MADKLEHQGRAAEVEMRTSASPEQVWNAWADPAKISQWFVDRAEGVARPGATVEWMFDEFGYRLPYYVVESKPGESLVLGGQMPGRPPFLLEISIKREGGETVVRLVNSGFLEGGSFDEEYEGVLSGWQLALVMLKYYAEHHYGVDKEQYLLMREADVDLTRVANWFTQPDKLNRWLTRNARVGESEFAFLLKDGVELNGTVAAITRREAGYIVPQANAMLELKAWAAGPKKIVAVRVTGWNSELPTRLRAGLEQALDSLTQELL